MENYILLILAGFFVGTFGTLIGAGGGFILVPLLLIFYPELSAETITAISIGVVAVNSISGSLAYAKSGRIDYQAGILFAVYTIPGSILGVFAVAYIPQKTFGIVFGILLVLLSIYLLLKKPLQATKNTGASIKKGTTHQILQDSQGTIFEYSYNKLNGILVSIAVGFISPLLGIGGGIIHVPAMVNWLRFPVFIATATSHFILAIMASVSVLVHFYNGNYADSYIVNILFFLAIGVIPGAQIGAYLSHKIKGNTILKLLAICLIVVGIRILIMNK